MMLNMMLPWFPIVLGAAVGARLIGPSKASWLGVTCALFWVIVVQTTTGVPFWADTVTLASLLAGSAAIVGLAHWSGIQAASVLSAARGTLAASAVDAGDGGEPVGRASSDLSEHHAIQRCQVECDLAGLVSGAITEFDGWLERHRLRADPWPAFDEFLRSLLYRYCGATHTRPYRILSEGDGLVPLRPIESMESEEIPSARKGILGHVATTGRTFYTMDPSQGELVEKLAANTSNPPAWCFAVRQGARSIGLVSVGRWADTVCPGVAPPFAAEKDGAKGVGSRWLRDTSGGAPPPSQRYPEPPHSCGAPHTDDTRDMNVAARITPLAPGALKIGRKTVQSRFRQARGGDSRGLPWNMVRMGSGIDSRALLRTLEHLTGQFWITLVEVCRTKKCRMTDPVSGLMTRESFLERAQRVADQSYRRGEPVAVAVVTVEGLRTLLDRGSWNLADDVVSQISSALSDFVRPDDLLGRYDNDRFLLMLRRADSELASLIATQLIERLTELPMVRSAHAADAGGAGHGWLAGGAKNIGIRCGVSGSGTGSPPVSQLVCKAIHCGRLAHETLARVANDVGCRCGHQHPIHATPELRTRPTGTEVLR